MKPKVFVSSTYYDLKHIRESVEKMLHNMNMDPVLFESSDIYFDHKKPLDISCYNEVSNTNMMILIIGGRYGSEATGQQLNQYVEKYEQEYVSITNKEYKTALSIGIPVYVFIDNNVHVEYETYKKNRILYKNIIEKKGKIDFAYADSVNIFEFISEVYQSGMAIYKFQKFEDIETQFRNQISGMLFKYLEEVRTNKNEREIKRAVHDMDSLIKKMDKMVQSIGEKVLEGEESKLNAVKKEQLQLELKYLAQNISKSIEVIDLPIKSQLIENLTDYLLNLAWSGDYFKEDEKDFQEKIDEMFWDIESLLSYENLNLSSLSHSILLDLEKVSNLIQQKNELKEEFRGYLIENLVMHLG